MPRAPAIVVGLGLTIPEGLLGREIDCGAVTVTAEMVAAYVRAVGDEATARGPLREAPPTFCLALRRGMTPELELPAHLFGVHGGHDLEFHAPLRVGGTYRVVARIADVYEKNGRSGPLVVVVREVLVRDADGETVVRLVEREIIRARPAGAVVDVPPEAE
jgi:hypothetical protein